MKKHSLVLALALAWGGWWMGLGKAERVSSKPEPRRLTGETCDSDGFLQAAVQAEKLRKERRVSVAEFVRMAKEPGTLILDARGREHYEALHIKGAVNLPYTSFATDTLEKLIPNKKQKILIYCRNNLVNAPPMPAAGESAEKKSEEAGRKPAASEEGAGAAQPDAAPTILTRDGKRTKIEIIREFPYPTDFDPPKIPTAGLNIPTYITLYVYGYEDVWELDPAVDPHNSEIEFETAQPSTGTTGESCDSAGFLSGAAEAEKLRVKRRVNAEEFVRMSREPGAIVLDARGRTQHEQLRVKGSINLPYTEMTAAALAGMAPNKSTRILIYCRNNLADRRPEQAALPVKPLSAAPRDKAGKPNGKKAKEEKIQEFPYPTEFDPPQIPKDFAAGLNIPTYITLYIYGYRNVWELDPKVDPNYSSIEFESGAAASK